MRLSLPFVLGIDELVDGNPIRRIAVPAQDIEGVLSGSGTVADITAEGVDLSSASWTRHPQLADGRARDYAQEHQAILDSWRGGFSYVQENEAAKVVGLRPRRSVPFMRFTPIG